MLRIISANVNGIRSAASKGFLDYLGKVNADIVCVQELKAQEADMSEAMRHPHGMHGVWHTAEKRGYSGVAIYSKQAPDAVQVGLGLPEFDHEGRYVRADFGRLTVISLYLPSGSSSEERQAVKYRFLDAFLPMLADLHAAGRDVVVCGDWNIAHHNIDLKNWKGNLKNSGFLPEERAWLSQFLEECTLCDTYRRLHPETAQYTWWSNRGRAYENNVGWRIDYQLASHNVAHAMHTTSVYTGQKFSDHAPIIMEYGFALSDF